MPHKFLIAIGVVFLVAGCVQPRTQQMQFSKTTTEAEAQKQRVLAVKAFYGAQQRVYNVGWPILNRARDLCPRQQGKDMGFNVWNKYVEPAGDWGDALATAYGLGDSLVVNVVAPDSPADRAGLKVGDTILALNNWRMPKGKNASVAYMKKRGALARTSPKSVKIEFLRKGKKLKADVDWTLVCDYAINADMNDLRVNAFATGQQIMIAKGMLRFVGSDDELAIVIGHEFAHNAMLHNQAAKQNEDAGAMGGFVIDMMLAVLGVNSGGTFTEKGKQIGGSAYSVGFEAEADYVGLYANALAGQKIEPAPDFWRKMAADGPAAIAMSETHPSTPNRSLALEKTINEIKQKIKFGRPLLPKIKKAKPATAVKTEENKDLN